VLDAQTLMFREAAEAPDVVARQSTANAAQIAGVAAQLKSMAPHAVVTLARGSSDNAATYAKYLIETRLGILTSSAAPSISSVYSAKAHLKGTVLIATSQSGKSPDIVTALQAAKEAGAFTIAFVNVVNSPLATEADIAIPLHAGPEKSVAATKSYLATVAGIAQLVAAWADDAPFAGALTDLPAQMVQAWNLDWSKAVENLAAVRDLYVIGRGVGFGAAQEAALKFKETCGLHAEAFSAAEVRHGPMALAKDGFPAFILSQNDETRAGVRDLITALAQSGADILLAGFDDPRALVLPTVDAHPALQPILMLQSFYRMAEQLSRARGMNPDNPPLLNKVTETI
jgi:glucosamine--fructose-6-phosphate aminotransferase (isomerizing)